MARKLSKYISFAFAIAVIIAFLKVLSWFPHVIQQDTLRRYDSVEEVRARLNIKDIYIPSYYPQSIQWPPTEILAQRKPFPALVIGFEERKTGTKTLVIHQSQSDHFIRYEGIGFQKISESVDHELNGKIARLTVGLCKGNDTCSSILWTEGKYRIHIIMRATPLELLKIAQSMNSG